MKRSINRSLYISIVSILLINSVSFSQSTLQIRKIDSTLVIQELDSLKTYYSTNKEIPTQYEVEILKALSYFPELSSIRIKFKTQRIKTTLNTRPTIGSLLFRRKAKRMYVIRIDTSVSTIKIKLKSANFNARVGVFGHEFNHIIDYTSRGLLGVLARGIAYSSSKSKEKFEKEIDLLTISRGLGWQLYDWSYFILNESVATPKYKEFKCQTYMTPEEIKKQIKNSASK